MSSPDAHGHHKGQVGGTQFMNVIEHHEEEDLDETSSDDGQIGLHLDSNEA